MKSASFLVLLIFSVMLMAFASALIKPAAAEDPIIVGKWDRTDGADMYTIYANRTTQTVLPGGTYYGTWDYDGSSGYNYIFHWEHSPPGKAPFIDYVTVAADGQSYSGYNNYGDHFNCVRVSGADSVPAADSEFPILYVAVGGGIAAIAAVGAVYYFFIANGSTGVAGTLAGGTVGASVAGGIGSIFETSLIGIEADPIENVFCNMLFETISNISNDLGYFSDVLRAGTSESADSTTKVVAESVVNSVVRSVPLKQYSWGGRAEQGQDGVVREEYPRLFKEVNKTSTPSENTGTSESSESGTSSEYPTLG